MVGAIATATEVQNNFEKYLALVMGGSEVIVTKSGKEIGRLIPRGAVISYLTDSLTGVLRGNYDLDEAHKERLHAKYETLT